MVQVRFCTFCLDGRGSIKSQRRFQPFLQLDFLDLITLFYDTLRHTRPHIGQSHCFQSESTVGRPLEESPVILTAPSFLCVYSFPPTPGLLLDGTLMYNVEAQQTDLLFLYQITVCPTGQIRLWKVTVPTSCCK